MSTEDDLSQWLRSQPLDVPVEIDGESVYLKVRNDGAELGVVLIQSYTRAQLHEALRQGFNSATQFEASLGRTPDGNHLVLNQWLPNVSGWTDAGPALESLLNQLSMWRAALAPTKVIEMDKVTSRNEQRLRMLYSGAK
jgi:hypothetical protein